MYVYFIFVCFLFEFKILLYEMVFNRVERFDFLEDDEEDFSIIFFEKGSLVKILIGFYENLYFIVNLYLFCCFL